MSTTEPDGSTDTIERQVAMAARRAARFTTFAEIDNVGPEAIEQIREDVVHLANSYIHDPLVTIMGDIIDQQELVFRLLEGKQKPALTRDLYLLAGVVSGMIAKASHDLGRPHDAMTHARTLYVCADNAGHAGLRAWARGLQSLVAYWAGRTQEAFSDEAGTRAELALARVRGDEVDGAGEALAPVLELEPARRIGGIVTSAARVHQALNERRHAGSPVARSLREEIESFCRVPAAALPG